MTLYLVIWFVMCPISQSGEHQVEIREFSQVFPENQKLIFCRKHNIALLANRVRLYKAWEEYAPSEDGIAMKVIKKQAVYYPSDRWGEQPYEESMWKLAKSNNPQGAG